MKSLLLTIVLFVQATVVFSQDISYARNVVDTLTSSHFWGRGYTNEGMKKAAEYIAHQFHNAGVQPMKGNNYLQHFSFPVNTFPGKMELTINGKALTAGKDFIVAPGSRGVKTNGNLVQKDSLTFISPGKKLVVSLQDKLTWSVSTEQFDYTNIIVSETSLDDIPSTIAVNIETKYVPVFKAANVCGMVKGTMKPDSIIVFTAHYDHLGGMGKSTYFPGANDNASGIAFLLNLAKYYAANPQPYSVAFIAFAAEEAGLIGSNYFVENPLVSLPAIRFLINVDLVGTGEEGITVVNASEFPGEFELLQKINTEHDLLNKINARGKAANSDHYYFSEKGVPAFFIYTLGGIKAYHDIQDISQTLPLTEFSDLFKLVVEFTNGLMSNKNW